MSVENVSHLDNKLIFICIDKPISPLTYFSDGRSLSVLQILNTGDDQTYITNNKITFSDTFVMDFTNGALKYRIWVTDDVGANLYNISVNMILAFEEID
jgi:type IV secretory pathway VirB6-like protein